MSENALRWALFDGVYYAALYIAPTEAPVPVSDGEVFVYFLDGESGAVLPASDVLPYDPNDTTKTSVPGVAEGVRRAASILYGDAAPSETPQEPTMSTQELDRLLAAEDEDDLDERQKRKEQKRKEKEERRRLKKEKRARRHHEGGEDEEEDEEEREDDREDADGLETEDHREDDGGYAFGGVAEDYGLGDGSYGSRRTVMARRTGGGGGGGGMSGALSALADRSSPVLRYIPAIHSAYTQLVARAEAEGGLLSVPEQEVVRALEHKLRQRAGLALHVEQVLRKTQQPDSAAAAAAEEEDEEDDRYLREVQQSTPEQRQADVRALEAQLRQLDEDLDVQAEVAQLVQVLPRPLTFEEQRARRVRPATRYSRFVDPSVRLLLDRAQAPPVNLYSPELASKYLEQRQRRERLLTFQRGLGKLGLHAPRQKPMEQWMTARELMVLAAATEVQPVAPNGYIARRYATAAQRVQEHTRRRLSTLQTQQQRTQQADDFRLHPLDHGGANSFFDAGDNANELLSTFESNTRQQKQMLPVYYDFSNLSGTISNGTADQLQQQLRSRGGAAAAAAAAGEHGRASQTLDGLLQTQGSGDVGLDGLDTSGGAHVLPLDDATLRLAKEHVLLEDEAQLAREVARQQAGDGMHSVYYDAGQRFLPSEGQVSMWYSASSYMDSTRPHSESHRSSTGDRAKKKDDPVRTWRDAAKRSILEECTCLLKGAHGRPKLLPKAQFEAVAKTLLERALLEQGRRSGVSLSLKCTNEIIPFTKDTERQLKKSVQSYVQRHFGEKRKDENGNGADSESRSGSDVDEEERGRERGRGGLQDEAVVTDSPQYV